MDQDQAATSRKKALDNPFNASHPVHEGIPLWAMSYTVPQLSAELKCRGLPHGGTRAVLIKRLQDHNKWIMTPAGRQEIYDRKLDIFQKQSLAEVVPFDHFPRLPIEIRLMIWELSLPAGPRILSVGNIYRSTDNLYFPKDDNSPNPAALYACRESREVARRRYRLCFGTNYLYADLLGGDVLYFGHRWVPYLGGLLFQSDSPWGLLNWYAQEEESHQWVQQKLSNSVVEDLKQVQYLAMRQMIWTDYSKTWRSRGGCVLRKHLKKFSGLKQLVIVSKGNKQQKLYLDTPGHVLFKDQLPTRKAFRLQKQFLEKGLDDNEKKHGVPDVRFVAYSRIPNIPGDDWDRDKGEPFYFVQPSPPPFIEPRRSARIRELKHQ